jgi:hypothetical protein
MLHLLLTDNYDSSKITIVMGKIGKIKTTLRILGLITFFMGVFIFCTCDVDNGGDDKATEQDIMDAYRDRPDRSGENILLAPKEYTLPNLPPPPEAKIAEKEKPLNVDPKTFKPTNRPANSGNSGGGGTVGGGGC